MKVLAAFILLGCAIAQATDYCPNGGEIYEWGISQQGITDIVSEHNKYRQQILDGKVLIQPRGKNIKMMKFDSNLAKEAKKVSSTCKMENVIASDDRWNWVGQNLYIQWSIIKLPGQNWAQAAASWFNEHIYFIYPNRSIGTTGGYTQLIWDDSVELGCDFISFFDTTKPFFPYAKLYTCNYGPGGNAEGRAPYERA